MIGENISEIKRELDGKAELVVVSKYRTLEEIREAYDSGHRVFAENRVQALLERYEALPKDIDWHLIGHLQSNKVKYIASFITCIQSVDSMKLLRLIQAEAAGHGRVISCLLQIHIAAEETKFGLSPAECLDLLSEFRQDDFPNIRIDGLMGMASNTDDMSRVEKEFNGLKALYDELKTKYRFTKLSMGMSGDYMLAVKCGSNIVRIGSKVFA